MNDISKIIESALRSVVENSSWHSERDVLWGDTSGNFVVQNPQYPREVYFHDFAGQQIEVGIAILDGDCNILYQENTTFAANPPRVTIGYPPRSNILHMKGGAKTLEGVSNQGYISQLEQFVARVGNPSIYNILDFRGLPSDPVSTAIFVEPGMYEKPSAPGVKRRWLGGTEDLATPIAALTSGQHQLAVIIFDTEAGTLTYSTTTAVTAAGSLPSRDELTDISSITLTPGELAVATFYLYNGQTAIEQADWLSQLDPRLTWIPFNSRVVASIVAGNHISIDNTDPENPIAASTDRVAYSAANVNNPPSAAQLTSAFGSPSTVGTGFLGVVNDNAGGTDEYLAWSDGTNWFYVTGTKAT